MTDTPSCSVWVGVGVLFTVATVVGLCALFLWLRDRGRLLDFAKRRVLGLIMLLVALTTIGWVAVDPFSETWEFYGCGISLVVVFVSLAMLYLGSEWWAGPEIYDIPVRLSSEEFEESVAKARATLPWFLEQVERNPESALIRFPMTERNGEVVHMWAEVESYQDGCFHVSPAYDPGFDDLRPLDSDEISVDQVEDWRVVYPDGRSKGAFSLIALFEHYEAQGNRLSPRMRRHKAQLIDTEQGEDA